MLNLHMPIHVVKLTDARNQRSNTPINIAISCYHVDQHWNHFQLEGE